MGHVSLFIVLMFLIFPCMSFAEIKEIVAEGSYNMGDGETPTVADSRALLQAKKNALEQAGTYVESYSKVRDIKLTEDEVQVLASGMMDVEILEQKRSVIGSGISFWVRIKARVNPDQMEEMAERIREKSMVADYKRIHEAYATSQKEIEELKNKLAAMKGEKIKVEAHIVRAERWFQSNEWLEKGKIHWLHKEYDDVIVAATVAILLNPVYADAYITRGAAYSDKGRQEKAIEDFNKAIILDPGVAICYYNRGISYYAQGDYEKALQDYTKAIALKSNEADFYFSRGDAHYRLGNKGQAISDFQKACDMGSDAGCRRLRVALQHKQ